MNTLNTKYMLLLLQNGLYLALDEMILDLQLMCQNAQKFNEGTSGIYRDSVRIAKFVESQQKEYLAVRKCRLTWMLQDVFKVCVCV